MNSPQRSFSPDDNRVLVATIGSERDARNASYDYEREREEYDHAMRLRTYGATMRQNFGPCG